MENTLGPERFVTCPLSPADIQRLESVVQKQLTPGIRTFLADYGFPQNVAPAIFQDEDAFVSAQSGAPDDAFAFAERTELLFAETPGGAILEIDGSVERIAFSSFADFLREFTSEPDDPQDLCWAVQLSFSTAAEQKVRDSIEELLQIRFSPTWEELGVSPAGVTSFRAVATGRGKSPLKRSEYPGWPSPIYFLDQRVEQPHLAAFKDFVRAWEESGLGFKLINYGVLPKDLPDNDA